MKVKQNLFPALLVALALTACNTEEETMQGADGRIALQVTSGIQTRAYDNQWETGDRIGIYAFGKGTTTVADGYGNIPYTTASGGTTGSFAPDGTTIYLPTDGTERDFVAYYPYTAGLTDGIYTVDVSNQSSQKAIDLMAAATQTADRTNPNVAFNFTHKLCKMELTLKPGSGMTGTELAGLTVELTGQQTAGHVQRDATRLRSQRDHRYGNPDPPADQCRRHLRRGYRPAFRKLPRHVAQHHPVGRGERILLAVGQRDRIPKVRGRQEIPLYHHSEQDEHRRDRDNHRLGAGQR